MNQIRSLLKLLILGCSLSVVQTVNGATAIPISLQTKQGAVLDVDLSNSITITGTLQAITINQVLPAGAAVAQTVSLNPPVIRIKPDAFFIDAFTVTYSITDQDLITPTVSSTIIVNVIPTDYQQDSQTIVPVETPRGAVAKHLINTCEELNGAGAGTLSAAEQLLLDRCREILQSIANGDTVNVKRALQRLAPEEVLTQIRMGKNIAERQMKNMGSRLGAIRKGSKAISADRLTFQIDERPLNLAELLPQNTWGGASADQKDEFNPLGMFISGNIGLAERDETDQEDGFNLSTYGTTLGFDYRLTRSFVLGGALGLASAQVDIEDNAGELDAKGFSLSQYGTYYVSQKSYIDYVVIAYRNTYDSTRLIEFSLGPTPVTAQATASTTSALYSLSISGGYEVWVNGGFSLGIKAQTDYINSTIDAYSERGAGAFNLSLQEQQFSSLIGSAGLQISYANSFSWGVMIPQLDIDWQHQFMDEAVEIKGRFVNSRIGSAFQFKSDQPDIDYFTLAAGISVVLPRGNTFFIRYESNLGQEHYQDHHIALGARFEF